MEHIISILVENKFGVLARVAGLFSARGYNIESLSVAPTLDPSTSMITIVTAGDGARVAVNLISEARGERHVDHDVLPAR
jgi:acetolactate synthase small subunit